MHDCDHHGAKANRIRERVKTVCQRIPPLWPLMNFVAVSPYFGLLDLPVSEADRRLRRVSNAGIFMPRSFYRTRIASGRIRADDLRQALRECRSTMDFETLSAELDRERERASSPSFPLLVTHVRETLDGRSWESFVVDQQSSIAASWFDMGQALWASPWKGDSLYRAWLSQTKIDRTPRLYGIRGIQSILDALPDTSDAAIPVLLGALGIPEQRVEEVLHAALLSVGGWAAWARYQLWQAERDGGTDTSLEDLLAIRLSWELILLRTFPGPRLSERWAELLSEEIRERPEEARAREVDLVLQTAFEIGYRRDLLSALREGYRNRPVDETPSRVLAVFCIDVRSEVFRRALEQVAPRVSTAGFAGFFGIPLAVRAIGTKGASAHLPVLFSPAYQVEERLKAPAEDHERLEARREIRLGTEKAWSIFKTSASSAFSFVESAGLLAAGKMLLNLLKVTPPSSPLHRGLKKEERRALLPDLDGQASDTGIPPDERPKVAASVLRNMGLVDRFPRLVLLVGHGSSTVNNPQASGLDCGACGGQTGEASARVAAALFNDPVTRAGLIDLGIAIPEETLFVAALHDTTTDRVTLFEEGGIPDSHQEDLARIEEELALAGALARGERAPLLTRKPVSHDPLTLLEQRSRDWAEVRPEWGLVGNAAFIAAPRRRTRGVDLSGRVFLHEYDPAKDPDLSILELILTAPMIVANWINMQYYGSVVDNQRFGCGNKVLHNVVGGAIGVFEGNRGDLRTGLSFQSLHDGHDFVHEPLRLLVLVEAARDALDRLLERHPIVRQLVEHGWIHLGRIGEDGSVELCRRVGQWALAEDPSCQDRSPSEESERDSSIPHLLRPAGLKE